MKMKEGKQDQGQDQEQDQEAQSKGGLKIGWDSVMKVSRKSSTWIISEVILNISMKSLYYRHLIYLIFRKMWCGGIHQGVH